MAKKAEKKVKASRILVVDDERAIRDTLKGILEDEGYEVTVAADGSEALDLFEKAPYNMVLCDIKMPKMDGIEVLEKLLEKGDVPVVMISGHGTIETAVDAMRRGAYDYIEKPLDLNRLLVSVRHALDRLRLVRETKVLRQKVQESYRMVGESEALGEIRRIIERVAPSPARVLITGENGTGKELVAHGIHALSGCANGPFLEVNCAAIPSELIESELFGHEKGSFSGADRQRIGKFELADGGTLFLDEIGDMSLSAQSKVLRALQENKITRVGGDVDIDVHPRVIAATNKNLLEEIKLGTFREDLYHRLSVILIRVPSLRERAEDIPLLIDYFLSRLAAEQGVAKKTISPEAVQRMQGMEWRGNIRELRNVVERLMILSEGRIELRDVERYVM